MSPGRQRERVAERLAVRERGAARIRKLLALLITVTLSLTYLVLGTDAEPPEVFQNVPDAAAHGLGYGVLTLSALATATLWNVPVAGMAAAVYAVGHGALLEWLQSRTPSRRADWRDLAADALGAATALGLAAGMRGLACRS